MMDSRNGGWEMAETTAASKYRWPAEWEPHQATWLAWPHNRDTWPGIFDRIPPIYAKLVETIARYEPVQILAGGANILRQAQQLVGHLPQVTLHEIPTNDAWIRDHGPTFVHSAEPTAPSVVDWQYNAWGGKYPPWDRDQAVPQKIAAMHQHPHLPCELVLEGGAIDGNGAGTLLTTRSCLLNPNRNPGLSAESAVRYLAHYLGAQHVIWLDGAGIAGDDTDGHVDQLARFVSQRTVVCARQSEPQDFAGDALEVQFTSLQRGTTALGDPLEVIPLYLPAPKCFQSQRLPTSYCNFYILNQAVIVPTFDDPADELALDTLRQLFPHRDVIPFPSLDLVWGLGAIHCLTQQQPA